jgi:hypothetical protein
MTTMAYISFIYVMPTIEYHVNGTAVYSRNMHNCEIFLSLLNYQIFLPIRLLIHARKTGIYEVFHQF